MMTRARRRRLLLAGSSFPFAKEPSAADPVVGFPEKWRDWADLLPDLVGEISGRLLSLDVAEYLRFRAVCKPWRRQTDDPRARVLDRRFRPRNWILPCNTPDPSPRRWLLNLATGASMRVELPAFSTHCHLGAADGLLILYHVPTKVVRLLDPLSNAATDLPAMSRSNIVAPAQLKKWSLCVLGKCSEYFIPYVMDGAALDDSTSPPTLVLSLDTLKEALSNIIVAKPGDTHWAVVGPGPGSHYMYMPTGRVLFNSLLSLGGRCYLASLEGSIYLLQLQPLPRLVQDIRSFLLSHDGRMLMVRCSSSNIELAFEPVGLFTVGGTTLRMEMLEVDVAGKRHVPLRSLGRLAAFVGHTHCLAVSSERFPSIVPDAVYMGYRHQQPFNVSMFHIGSSRTEPPHQFDMQHQDWKLVPHSSPCNLDQYLVCYVDRKGIRSGQCIIHGRHGPTQY
ncbi:hypothetical protein PVAP13_3NG127300 [Panicum virgatum]|uniref:KIB1-4 beta-propeller domain-containing protein n=1 Tax=Panicum virgatum TaxID=38727 RepID=A0A8T0UFB5_PANVG|nr:hypothetical protein PVAP13_3NG127300 [Panicum virgatum]